MNSVYDLKVGKNGDIVVIKDLVKVFDNPNHSAFTRMISLGLRHGASIQYVVEQLQKDRDSVICLVLLSVSQEYSKNYIPDGQRATEKTVVVHAKRMGSYMWKGVLPASNCGFAKCG